MSIGTEHEYSVTDLQYNALPISDQILKSICGRYESEILFGDVKLGKELQKHVLEFIPRFPVDTIPALEVQLVRGIQKFFHIFQGRYHLLGLGMHPTLTLDKTAVWDHDEGDYYEAYDRLFNIRQHGWLNIQALQINLSYEGDTALVAMYNRLRALLPYLIAITASSPIVEGRLTGSADNRLLYYLKNQKEIPAICHGIIPDPIRNVDDYRAAQENIFSELKKRNAAILCEEWVNSGGVIVRFSRRCLEIKALDEQECVRSDMAVCAFVQALMRCSTPPPVTDQEGLAQLLDEAIREGTAGLRPELEGMYACAWQHATDDERAYLPVIRNRIENGSLAELMRDRYENEGDIASIMKDMAQCLRENRPYGL